MDRFALGKVTPLERGIIMSGQSVRATLERRKWVTRRPVGKKKCPYGVTGDYLYFRETWAGAPLEDNLPPKKMTLDKDIIRYRATFDERDRHLYGKWRASIHMPKSVTRIRVQILDIDKEPLQDITEEDALAEGIRFIDYSQISELQRPVPFWDTNLKEIDKKGFYTYEFPSQLIGATAVDAYHALWDSMYADEPLMMFFYNPLVWRIEYTMVDSG